jgi:hypothetical protein
LGKANYSNRAQQQEGYLLTPRSSSSRKKLQDRRKESVLPPKTAIAKNKGI